MVPNKFTIYDDINGIKINCVDSDNITYTEWKRIVKSGKILNKIFKYREVEFRILKPEVIPKPFLNTVLMRLLTIGKCFFQDKKGIRTNVTVRLCLQNLIQYMLDFLQKGFLVKRAFKDVDKLGVDLNKLKNLDLSLPPLYFRTDLCFGLTSGGSVGHIAGVVNNFNNFTGQPAFFSSDDIPTVKETIKKIVVNPERKYQDFFELNSIYYNKTFAKRVMNEIITKDVSFIYQRYSTYNYCGLKLSKELNVPFVLEYNGSEIWINRNWGGKPLKYEKLAEKIEMLNLRVADLIVVVSEPMKEELVGRGIEPEKILVNPNGVNTDMYSPEIDGSSIRRKYDLDNKIVVGFIGTFGKWHGAEVLAAAFGKLLKENPWYKDKVRLLMIGDGMTMDQVKANLQNYNVYDESILTGTIPQEEGPSYLAACDILASPHVPNPDGSRFFGSPTKLFEYMAMGKGIVASDLEQIGEILKHNVTAYMVKPGDAESLKEGLKELVENEDLRIRLGKAARDEVVGKYTWKQHTSNIIEALKEVCK